MNQFWTAPGCAYSSSGPPGPAWPMAGHSNFGPPPGLYPASPPPPYDMRNYNPPPQLTPVPFYQQQHYSEQHLQPAPSGGALRKKKSQWMSTTNLGSTPLSQQPTSAPCVGHVGLQGQPWQSTPNLPTAAGNSNANEGAVVRSMNQGAALCDRVASRLNDVLCRLEGGTDAQSEEEIEAFVRELSLQDDDLDASRAKHVQPGRERKIEDQTKSGGLVNFKKTWMYANSRLPPQMLPLKVYVPTWSIFCRAADAAMAVYHRPKGDERQEYVDADWRQGTKAMTLKSVCLDEKNLIVFAIRGSKWNLFDWAVNFRPAPSEPVGFLDDTGNACHSGFLHVAKSMIRPVAARLRQLLEQDPGRAGSSLVLTGHSAGGAVASLLYMHMLSTLVESELTILTGCFRRVHCVTFGAPPVSLLPLQKPNSERNKKNVFIAFANEGDLVVRADKQYVASLCRLIASPPPTVAAAPHQGVKTKASRQKLRRNDAQLRSTPASIWPVPDAPLSNAGRVVLLRKKPAHPQSIEAVCVSDQELRGVVFGDPSMHDMALYKRRIDELAIAAVTGRDD